MENKTDFLNPMYYENRELSWLQFNTRILNEARDTSLPLLERLKFLAITSSNLDEFFMVRVASLKDMVHAKYKKVDLAGMTPQEQLDRINEKTRDFVTTQYTTLNRSLLPGLKKQKIQILTEYEQMTEKQSLYADRYFEENIYPVVTPMAVDASRPFPLILNRSLNIAALIQMKPEGSRIHYSKKEKSENTQENIKKEKSELEFATVQVPAMLPRMVPIPSEKGYRYSFILLEQIIEKNIGKLFLNYDVVCAYPYRVMRNADFSFDEDEASDLLKEIEKQLKKRQWGEVIRLEVEESMDSRLLTVLKDNLNVKMQDVFKINGPMDLTFFFKLHGLEGCDSLRYPDWTPQNNPRLLPGADLFSEIRKGDIVVSLPYESFDPVVNFIRQGAVDPDVLAIKQTLYRVSGNSPIIAALAKAAENGKQVTVLVELKARFDEENNIGWAKKLEKAGCHVIYGIVGLKTHCKIALIVRREEDTIRRYVHLGTGNYNDSTAKLYTDCGMFTCREAYGEDATAVFNMLSGYSEPKAWNRLIVAPIWMRDKFMALIQREIQHAREGKRALIIAKMNSLCDQNIIAALYEASQSGVEIYLIIRGICCLKVGIPGISEHIHVSSLVGNFLEHSRIFYFYNNEEEEIYMGSADWMPRNLDKRIEIVFPVEDEKCRAKIKHILDVQLKDNLKAYYLNSAGEYERLDRRGKKPVGAQLQFCQEAKMGDTDQKEEWTKRTFIPRWAASDMTEEIVNEDEA